MNPAPDQIIVHGPDSGADFHRLDRILALKGIDWSFNRLDRAARADFPGDEEESPLLQIGGCFFCGSLLATLALECVRPAPSLFPNGNRGMPLALAWWSEALFQAGRRAENTREWHTHCTLFRRQLADGRAFLQGESPGLADVHAYAPLRALQQLGHDLTWARQDSILGPWFQRVAQIGTGSISSTRIEAAHLLHGAPAADADQFPDCDALAQRETLPWHGKTLFLWRSPFAA